MESTIPLANPTSPTPTALLRSAQLDCLSQPPRRHGWLAQILFVSLDAIYGDRITFGRFAVLELIARVPYQAWENVGYVAISHTYSSPGFARRIFEYAREARAQQDNEQWHLLIVEELAKKHGEARSWLLFRALPQLIAFVYYHVSWLLYVVAPRMSYALNVDFEDHAERVYMQFVADHPELGIEPWESEFAADYGSYASVADVLRRIALDERVHRDESLARIEVARFGDPVPPLSELS
jgi:ubiquinol oxidase